VFATERDHVKRVLNESLCFPIIDDEGEIEGIFKSTPAKTTHTRKTCARPSVGTATAAVARMAASDERQPPSIKMIEGEQPTLRREINAVLQRKAVDLSLMIHSKRLVQPRIEKRKGFTGDVLSLELQAIDVPAAQAILNEAIVFERFDERKESWVPKNCPDAVAKTLLSMRVDWEGIPEIERISERRSTGRGTTQRPRLRTACQGVDSRAGPVSRSGTRRAEARPAALGG